MEYWGGEVTGNRGKGGDGYEFLVGKEGGWNGLWWRGTLLGRKWWRC